MDASAHLASGSPEGTVPPDPSSKPASRRDLCSHTSLALMLALGSTSVVFASFALHTYLPGWVELGALAVWLNSHVVAVGVFVWGLILGERGGAVGTKTTLGTYFTLLLAYGFLAYWSLSNTT